jgi:hypothetical protein
MAAPRGVEGYCLRIVSIERRWIKYLKKKDKKFSAPSRRRL